MNVDMRRTVVDIFSIFGVDLERTRSIFAACLEHIWSILGAYLEHIWSILGAYLEHVWNILGAYTCIYMYLGREYTRGCVQARHIIRGSVCKHFRMHENHVRTLGTIRGNT